MTVGTYLRNLREQNGYTMQNIVDMVDGQIDKTTISRVENDERKPSLLTAYLLSQLYDLDMKDIAIRTCGKVIIKK
ncbi:MAG: helix-turn-helix transcriptional regulator [Victivallales bacterium]